jgi:predicted MFS family arabinose efflux permease
VRNWAWYRGNLANMLTMACHMSVVTLLPLYWRRHGIDDSEIGWMASGFAIAAILARSRLGHWLEEWGRRPFLYLGCLMLTAMPMSYPFLKLSFLPWFALRLLQGTGYAFYITAVLTWVADRSPPDRIAQGQGVFGVSGLLGSAIGPMGAESVYQLYGFPTMFKMVAGVGVVAICLVASLPESSPGRRQSSATRAASLRLSDHRAMLWATIPFGWVVGTVITFIAPFGDSVGLSNVALYFVGFALASITVRLGSGSIIDTMAPARLVQVAGGLLALSALSLACLPVWPHPILLFSAAVLNGIGHGFLFPALSAYTVRRAQSKQRGSAVALFTGVFDSGFLVGSVVAGYFAQFLGYSSAYVLAALLLLGALPIFSALDQSSSDPIPVEELHVDPNFGETPQL